LFLLLGSIFLGKPVKETILSAHGVLVASKPTPLTLEQNAIVLDLLQKGALISSSDLLAQITAFYSTIIQVLIGTFFVFGVLSLFAVQANARRQIEDVAETLVDKAAEHHFNTLQFDARLREKIDSALQVELEPYDELGDELRRLASELEDRVKEIKETVDPAKVPEEE
jgi:polyhydroxyalkanoate synthesis regulator protein